MKARQDGKTQHSYWSDPNIDNPFSAIVDDINSRLTNGAHITRGEAFEALMSMVNDNEVTKQELIAKINSIKVARILGAK